MTLTATYKPYRRLTVHDAQIAEMDWEYPTEWLDMNHHPVLLNTIPTLHRLIMQNANPETTFTGTNSFICYDPSDLNRRIGPDFYVAFGVDKDAIQDRYVYLIWEVGKPPDFVLEIASPSTAMEDLTRKRDIYAQIGVTEYWRFDPRDGDLYGDALVGETLVDGEYQTLPITTEPDGFPKGYSPTLGLTMSWRDGEFRAYNQETGEYYRTPDEDAARVEEQEAVIEEQRDNLDDANAQIRQLQIEIARLRSENNDTGR